MSADPQTMRYDISAFQGGLPPGFDPGSMPEWDFEGGMSFRDAVESILSYAKETHDWMGQKRSDLEAKWSLSRRYYNMGEELKQDSNRRASVFINDPSNPDKELNPERAAVVLPLTYEAVQQLQSRLFQRMFGTGPEYVEFKGRTSNDLPGAGVAEDVMNYQQSYLIPTTVVGNDWINYGLVEGFGVVSRMWDYTLNCPRDEVHPPQNVWIDPAYPYAQLGRWAIVRRYPTISDLMLMRQNGSCFFTDEDMMAALGRGPEENEQRKDFNPERKRFKRKGAPHIYSDRFQVVTLDVFMEREPDRWIYVVNRSLVIAVLPSPLPRDEHRRSRFPISTLTPVRDPDSPYGDSITYRMCDSQDLCNAMIYMSNKNLARNALGLLFADPSISDHNQEVRAGDLHLVPEPSKNVFVAQLPDVTGVAINNVEYVRREIADKVSGMTDSTRGQAYGANQTATGTQTLINEANSRLEQMALIGQAAIQEYHTIGLLLNQAYLAPMDAIHIAENTGVWRPAQGSDLFGVAGRDIIPTGFPVSGSRSYWAQQGMNLAVAIQNLGGNPRPILKRVLDAMQIPEVDQIFPDEDQIGHSPIQENYRMVQGHMVQLDPNDDDLHHLNTHYQFAMNPDVQNALMRNTQAMLAFRTHIAWHMSRYQQQQQLLGAAVPGEQPQTAQSGGVAGMALEAPRQREKPQSELDSQMAVTAGGGNAA